MSDSKGRRELTRSDYARRGLVAVVALALIGGLVWLRSSGTYGGPEHVEAQLKDAGGSLSPGADVKVRGVIVGRVVEIGRGPESGVRVRIAIKPDRLADVPADVQARILPATVFGTSYVDLATSATGATPRLEPGAVIPADTTVGTLELQQALDDIDRLVKAVGPAELASAIGSAAQALDGRGTQIGGLIDGVADYLGKLNPKMPLVARDVRKLATNIVIAEQLAPEMFAATKDALVAARTVVTQKAAITAILGGGTALASQATVFLGTNEQALVRFLNNSGTLLDAVYDNRHVGITEAFATNRLLDQKLASIMNHGFANTVGRMDIGSPGKFYTSADCPRFGNARGANCAGLARAGVGSMLEGERR